MLPISAVEQDIKTEVLCPTLSNLDHQLLQIFCAPHKVYALDLKRGLETQKNWYAQPFSQQEAIRLAQVNFIDAAIIFTQHIFLECLFSGRNTTVRSQGSGGVKPATQCRVPPTTVGASGCPAPFVHVTSTSRGTAHPAIYFSSPPAIRTHLRVNLHHISFQQGQFSHISCTEVIPSDGDAQHLWT